MLRTLVLLRHGKSDWSVGAPDLERPLTGRGTRQAAEAGRWLASGGLLIDLAVVSPALRATSTWDLAARELEPPPPTRVDERVYAAPARSLLEVVRELDPAMRTVVLVGHNPGLEDLVELLTGDWLPLPTSSIAVVGLPGPWSAAGDAPGVLRGSGRPPPPLTPEQPSPRLDD